MATVEKPIPQQGEVAIDGVPVVPVMVICGLKVAPFSVKIRLPGGDGGAGAVPLAV